MPGKSSLAHLRKLKQHVMKRPTPRPILWKGQHRGLCGYVLEKPTAWAIS